MTATANHLHEIAETHRPWLERVIASRMGGEEPVEEVFSEVLLALSKADQVPSDDGIKPWLCRIAIRQSALYHRKKFRQRELADGYAFHQECLSEEELDPMAWLLDQERKDLMQVALRELASEDREILLMKFVRRLTYQAIGDHLSIARHVAEYRVVQAKKKLRTIVTSLGLDEEDVK